MFQYWTPQQIGHAGEKIVVQRLLGQGWHIDQWDTQAPGSTDIAASANGQGILVQVKASLAPGVPATLSDEEKRNITSRAARLNRSAYWVQVVLNPVNLEATAVNFVKL
jgi:Holliday junction resolvase-like predicted endonuclease